MSFDRLSSLEAQPTTTRRTDDPEYRDDPEFDKLTEKLSTQLFTLISNISQLTRQIALFGTKKETPRVRERVQNLLDETRDGFKDLGAGVKELHAYPDVNVSLKSLSIQLGPLANLKSRQPRQKRAQTKITQEFRNALEEFQSVQRRALEKQRASRTAVEESFEVAGDYESQQQLQMQQQQQQHEQELAPQSEVMENSALIEQREEAIENITTSMQELSDIFQDVAHIVHEQGGQLELISDNVENTRLDTRGADRELRTASRYQRNARSKACCLLLILSVILIIVILAVVLG